MVLLSLTMRGLIIQDRSVAFDSSLIRVSVLRLRDELVIVAAHRNLLHAKVFTSCSRFACRKSSSGLSGSASSEVVGHLGVELLSSLGLRFDHSLRLDFACLSDGSCFDAVLGVWLRNSRLWLSFRVGTALG